MVELEHPAEPLSLEAYRNNHPIPSWSDEDFILAKTEVRHALHREQQGLCIYCEGKIGQDDGHVEHIQSRAQHPGRVFAFDNLAHSCNGPKHCGHFKDKNTLPIEPRPGCNSYFDLMARDGMLTVAAGLNEGTRGQAETTLEVLGLNTPKLVRLRQQYATILRSLASDTERKEFLRTNPFRWSLQGM